MIRTSRPAWPALFALCLGLPAVTAVRADFRVEVTFDDPGNAHAARHAPIAANLKAAGAEWAARLVGNGAIEVRVDFAAIAGATGRSATSGFFFADPVRSYFEQGAAAKIRTGIDLNGAAPDAFVTLGTDYLANDLWFDPDPSSRTAPVPADKVDAFSVMLHELGHILVFNGWRDPATGAAPADYMSTFDAQIEATADGFALSGPLATLTYGGPVPLTNGSLYHLGNLAPGAGADLADDLMNGVGIAPGRRYGISTLDLAIAADTGLTLRPAPVPEPASIALLAIGAAGLTFIGRRGLRKPS